MAARRRLRTTVARSFLPLTCLAVLAVPGLAFAADGDADSARAQTEVNAVSNEVKSVQAAIEKAKGTDTEKLIAAMEGMSFETPKGTMTFRKEDHQALQSMYHFKVKKDGKDDNDLLDLVQVIAPEKMPIPVRNKR